MIGKLTMHGGPYVYSTTASNAPATHDVMTATGSPGICRWRDPMAAADEARELFAARSLERMNQRLLDATPEQFAEWTKPGGLADQVTKGAVAHVVGRSR